MNDFPHEATAHSKSLVFCKKLSSIFCLLRLEKTSVIKKCKIKKGKGWITYVDFKVAHQLLNLVEGFAALGCIAGVFAIVEVPNRS
jgi:hypothetical protein